MATPTQSPGPSRRLPTVDDALALIRQKTGIYGETLLEVFMFVYSVASDVGLLETPVVMTTAYRRLLLFSRVFDSVQRSARNAKNRTKHAVF